MKTRIVTLLVAALLVATLIPADAQEVAPAKKAEIEKLLETTGALKLGQQLSSVMVAQLTNELRAARPDIPQKALDVLPEEVDGVLADNLPAFEEVVVRIYDRHFTLEELREINRFYASKIGRKVVGELPSVMQESVAAGQKWGQSLGPEISRRLRARFAKENIPL